MIGKRSQLKEDRRLVDSLLGAFTLFIKFGFDGRGVRWRLVGARPSLRRLSPKIAS